VPSLPRPSDRRPGVTLLELLVVVLLLGVAAALTAPALLRERADAGEHAGRGRVTAFARAAAVRRGETLALDVAADGRWTLRVARGDSLPLADGTLDAADSLAPRRLLVTPLGLCLPDDDASAPAPWDAGSCRP